MPARIWPDPPAEPEGFARTIAPGGGGARLAVYGCAAAEPARAALCLLHDVAEHAARYAAAARALAAAGVHVYAHDHRGHGGTRAPDASPGVFARRSGLERVMDDAVAVHERARARHPGLPVLTLGLGVGGLVALLQALARPDASDGIAIWNAETRPEHARAIRRALSLDGVFAAGRPNARMQARFLRAWSAPFAPTRTPYDWLSRDAAEVDRYADDPACGFAPSASLWRDVARGIERACDPGALGAVPRGTPFHLLGGSADPVTERGAAVIALDARLRDAGFADVSRVILEDARHDTLHDLCRDEAVRLLARWIERVAAG